MILTDKPTASLSPSPFALIPWRGRTLLLMGMAMLTGIVVGSAILAILLMPETLTGGEVQVSTTYMLSVLALQATVMLLCIYCFGVVGQRSGWHGLGFAAISWRWVWQALGLTVVLRIIVGLLAALLMQIGIVSQQPLALAPEGFSWFGATGMILLAGIVVPIAEEIFFRGMLYRWMRSRWSLWPAVLVSSLLFAAIHVELATVIPAVVIGAFCAISFERSRTLWTPILIHCANNLIAIGLLYALLAAGVPIPGIQ